MQMPADKLQHSSHHRGGQEQAGAQKCACGRGQGDKDLWQGTRKKPWREPWGAGRGACRAAWRRYLDPRGTLRSARSGWICLQPAAAAGGGLSVLLPGWAAGPAAALAPAHAVGIVFREIEILRLPPPTHRIRDAAVLTPALPGASSAEAEDSPDGSGGS